MFSDPFFFIKLLCRIFFTSLYGTHNNFQLYRKKKISSFFSLFLCLSNVAVPSLRMHSHWRRRAHYNIKFNPAVYECGISCTIELAGCQMSRKRSSSSLSTWLIERNSGEKLYKIESEWECSTTTDPSRFPFSLLFYNNIRFYQILYTECDSQPFGKSS